MKIQKSLALAIGLFATSSLAGQSAFAAQVKTAGQAMSLCKQQAEAAHPEYKRSKSTKIKQKRGTFKITLKVFTESEKFKTFCEVSSDGAISYAKA